MKSLKLHLSTTHASLDRRRRETGTFMVDGDDYTNEVFAVSLFTVSLLQVRIIYSLCSPPTELPRMFSIARCRYEYGYESGQNAGVEAFKTRQKKVMASEALDRLVHFIYYTSHRYIRRE